MALSGVAIYILLFHQFLKMDFIDILHEEWLFCCTGAANAVQELPPQISQFVLPQDQILLCPHLLSINGLRLRSGFFTF